MLRHFLASLSPYVVLLSACGLGGAAAWAGLFYMTGFVVVMDRMPLTLLPTRPRRGGNALLVVLAVAHGLLMGVLVYTLAHGGFGTIQGLALGAAAALCFGQVSNSAAHELIHRPRRALRALGVSVYISLLFGHHASAHRRVHHVWVASDRDPNSARRGEGFWRFLPRAWWGSFVAGWRAETALRQDRGVHPYAVYIGGALVMLALAGWIGGLRGVAVMVAVSGYAQLQLLLADYIQHYGLRRQLRSDGRLEPAGPQHSWNAPHWYSSAMMLNAPRHSDHHQHPGRAFAELRLNPDMPTWPYSMPVMAVLATIPPLWRRVMAPRLKVLARQGW